MSFGQRLKLLRRNCGMSQSELAKALGVSKSTISMCENDNRKPRHEELETIADYFNVGLDNLFRGKLEQEYYIDPEAAELAQELKDNPDLRIMLDASRNISPEDLRALIKIVKSMKEE